jgi:hypothetical protein
LRRRTIHLTLFVNEGGDKHPPSYCLQRGRNTKSAAILTQVATTALIVAELLAPPGTAFAAQKYTQYAQQCVNRQDYPVGTNHSPNAFTRFYNKCNFTISLMLTTNNQGNNGPGAPGSGAFMVMGWPDNAPKDVHYFACVYPGEPVKPGSTFVNPPSYGNASYQCLVP